MPRNPAAPASKVKLTYHQGVAVDKAIREHADIRPGAGENGRDLVVYHEGWSDEAVAKAALPDVDPVKRVQLVRGLRGREFGVIRERRVASPALVAPAAAAPAVDPRQADALAAALAALDVLTAWAIRAGEHLAAYGVAPPEFPPR